MSAPSASHVAAKAADPSDASGPVDLGQVLLGVAGRARAAARARRVLLSVEVEPGALLVPGAPDTVHDVVLGVVGRAVATCPPGALVVLDAHAEDGGVAVDVTDTGPGTPAGAPGSSGASAVAPGHGGRVTSASVEGVGTTVRVWWPRLDREVRGRGLAAVRAPAPPSRDALTRGNAGSGPAV